MKLFWRELTDDGLLKQPKIVGPYYDEYDINNYGEGFETEEFAVKKLKDFKKQYPFDFNGEYILVKVY